MKVNKSSVSIIVPCRNEVENISKLFDSIEKMEFQKQLIEVLVIDGMSDDGTRDKIFSLIENKRYTYTLKLIDNVKQKTPFAFNIGIKESVNEIIVICGARFILSSNYLSILVNSFSEQIACVGGSINNNFQNETSRIISLAMASPFGIGFNNFRSIKEDTFVDTVTPPAFKRIIFEEIGYFDERLTRNQDDEYSYRIIKAGYKILLKADISIEYMVRASFNKLFRQYKQYGYWKVFVNKKHKTVTTVRQLFPAIFLLSIVGLFVLGFLNPLFVGLFLIEIFFYLLLSFIFAFKAQNLTLTQRMSFVFTCFILHTSYGWGYLQGIIDFLLLNRNPNSDQEKLSR